MSNEKHTPGQPYEIKPLIIHPEREQTYGYGSEGGGYSGNGSGWGLHEGRPRGTGGKSSIRGLPPPNAAADILDEQVNNQRSIEEEYKPRFKTLPADIERELSQQKTTRKGAALLTRPEAAEADQRAALQLIESKKYNTFLLLLKFSACTA